MNKDNSKLKDIILSNDQDAFRKALVEKNIHITAEQLKPVFNDIVAYAKADNIEAIVQALTHAMTANQPINDEELEKINAAGITYNQQTGKFEFNNAPYFRIWW